MSLIVAPLRFCLIFRLPANRAKHLARVATEYTQLLYHVSKAREENCVFINGVRWVSAYRDIGRLYAYNS